MNDAAPTESIQTPISETEVEFLRKISEQIFAAQIGMNARTRLPEMKIIFIFYFSEIRQKYSIEQ